jgi:hypothetical protein
MKGNKPFLAFALLALLTVRGAAGVQEDFATANRKYEQGKYAEALPLYLAVNRQVSDWKVLYNIGNCRYKLGQFLAAKLDYLKARERQPMERSIEKNIAMVNRHFPDISAAPAPDFVSRSILLLESMLSLDALSVMLLLAVLLLNACLFQLLTKGKNKKILYAFSFFLILSLTLGAYHLSRVAALGQSGNAMVWEEGSLLRSGPGEDNTVLFKIHPGLEVKIIDHLGEWAQVKASAQVVGWIEKKRLAVI